MITEQIHFLFEQVDDLHPCLPGSWNGDALSCSRCDIEHCLELGIAERLNRLMQMLNQ